TARRPGRAGNERAATFARTYGLPGVAVSDAHSILEVGLAHSLLQGDPSTAAGPRAAPPPAPHSFADGPAAARAGSPIGRLIERARGAIGSSANRTDSER